MKRKQQLRYMIPLCLISLMLLGWETEAYAQNSTFPGKDTVSQESDTSFVKKALFIGDSMTGWMAERLNAYGEKNEFEVATIVWDGSTITKWADASNNLDSIIEALNPDALFVSLGMNELFEHSPETKLKKPIEKLKKSFGSIPLLWIGPPSWPGHTEGENLNAWMENELGKKRFFRSLDLDLPRQSKSNPHPSKEGIALWIDKVAEWIPEHSELNFKSLTPPEKDRMSRGDVFIYKRMKENL